MKIFILYMRNISFIFIIIIINRQATIVDKRPWDTSLNYQIICVLRTTEVWKSAALLLKRVTVPLPYPIRYNVTGSISISIRYNITGSISISIRYNTTGSISISIRHNVENLKKLQIVAFNIVWGKRESLGIWIWCRAWRVSKSAKSANLLNSSWKTKCDFSVNFHNLNVFFSTLWKDHNTMTIIWLCITRTGNYYDRIHEFNWLR